MRLRMFAATVIVITAVFGSIFGTSAAFAARPPLDPDRTQDAALEEMNQTIGFFDSMYDDKLATGDVEVDYDDDGETDDIVWNVLVTGWEMDDCEIERRRGYCDFTMSFSDGDQCDGTVEVERTRRGRYVHDKEDMHCDREDW